MTNKPNKRAEREKEENEGVWERALEAYVQALGKKRTSAEDFHGVLHEMNMRREWIN